MNALVITDQPFIKGRHLTIPEGMTLQQMIDLHQMPAMFEEHGVIYVGDYKVPRELWIHARPQKGLTVRAFVELRGGAARSVLALVATIAIIAAATFISGGALLPFLGPAFAAGHIGAILGAAGVSLLGSLAVGALTAKGGQQGSEINDTGETPNGAALSGNILNPDGRLPRSIGRNIVFPPFITRPLTEVVGDDIFIEGIVALAGPHVWEELRASNSDVADMDDITVETRPGLPGDPPLTLVSRYGWEVGDPIELTTLQHDPNNVTLLLHQADPYRDIPQWHRITTKESPDEFWITINWAEGLWDDANSGNERVQSVRLRMRRRGATTWINLPELMYKTKKNRPFQKQIKLIWSTNSAALPTAPITNGFCRAYYSVPVATYANVITTGGWLASGYFNGGANIYNTAHTYLYNDRVEIYLDPATFPMDTYEVEVIKGTSWDSTAFTETSYSTASGVPDLYGMRDNGSSQFDFYGYSRGTIHDKARIAVYASVKNTHPVANPGTDAVCAIKVKNRRVDQFSAVVSGITYAWSGSDWSVQSISANPAMHFVQLHLDPKLSAYTVDPDQLDNDSILAWQSFCETMNLECNLVVESESWEDVRNILCAAGQALPKGLDLVGVAYEHDRSAESPIHAITPVNSRGDQWTVPLDRRPDALIVTFRDERDDYNIAQLIVYDDGVTVETAIYYDSVQYGYITNRQQAADQALKDMRKARLRATIHRREIAAEGLLLEIGDLVAVQDDVLTRIGGHSRVKATTLNGSGQITSIQLYSAIPVVKELEFFAQPALFDVGNVFDLGITSGIAIKSKAGTIVTKPLSDSSGLHDVVTPATPIVVPAGGIQKGDMIWVGPSQQEHKRMLVLGIGAPNEDLEFGLSLVDEASDIQAATPVVEIDEDFVAPGEMSITGSYHDTHNTRGTPVDKSFTPLGTDLGAVAGDFVLVFIVTDEGDANVLPTTWPPTGWHLIEGYNSGGYGIEAVLGRKIDGTETSLQFIKQNGRWDFLAVKFSNAATLTPTYGTSSLTIVNDGGGTQTINVSVATLPTICWAWGWSNDGTTGVVLSTPSYSLTLKQGAANVEDFDLTGLCCRFKIAVDNLALVNKTVNMGDDYGEQRLGSGFVAFS